MDNEAPVALRDACVLVVDDQDANVHLLEQQLRSAGVAQVHSLTDARETVRRCQELEPDVLLLDLHMPHLDGLAVLTALRPALPAGAVLPVMILTGDSSPDTKQRALAGGADDFLAKPCSRVELLRRVAKLLDTRASVDPSVLDWLRSSERCPTTPSIDMVALFVGETRDALGELRACLIRGDAAGAARSAHTVKGTSASFGARHLPALCAEVERSIADGDRRRALRMLAPLDAELDLVAAALHVDFAC